MIGLHAQHNYYLYSQPADMRKSFDGLSGLVRNGLRRNPTSGEVYIFLNRKRNIIKLLLWEGSGFAIYSKRLEQGSYERPGREDQAGGIQLSWEELVLILQGIALGSIQRRKRYAGPQTGENRPIAGSDVENRPLLR